MANLFDIAALGGRIQPGKDKAIALAGQLALNGIVGGHVLPPLPPFPANPNVTITRANPDFVAENVEEELTTQGVGLFGFPMCFPLSIKTASQGESDWWLLPVEPMITLGGGNTVVKRNVAKSKLRGSIKERWNVEDYTINITGLFTKKDNWTYPKADVLKLRRICEAREPIDVKCDLLEVFKIGRMVIEKYDFPFTKGEENQAYTISALSDDDWDLFIKLDS